MSGTSYILVNIEINLGFDRAKSFNNVLDFAICLVNMSLLSTKTFHLELELLWSRLKEVILPF
jgi:hypothetical protein